MEKTNLEKTNLEKTSFRHIVRIAQTDLDGSKSLICGLRKVKGINFMFANLICSLLSLDKRQIIGEIKDSDIQKIDYLLKNPIEHNVPEWMLNRRIDPEEGDARHLISTDVRFVRENDIKMLKKMKSYKGIRHMYNLPVRGQRTQAHFRKSAKKSLGIKKKVKK